ncbi:CPBP family intramembrane metalloprotease [Staphylococcus saprophyticus]|uniref:CPBP family intramembrane glutamic endopeptidase n=1 Tax=Staphylococcus saprophyticus TaxID=29385 RepID=UPI002DBC3B76|nr:type II CAAX endopeptidase family protein [Staphylococcus saprophyticus]MEB7678035.1 CPBP family intramembrane metalloprotease [Staphylococcus saprophyticus]
MQFHLNNNIKEIFHIIAFTIIGIAIFEVSLQIKFIADKLNFTLGYLLAISIVIILYSKYIKYIKIYKMLNIKYLRPIILTWETKYLILAFGILIHETLTNLLASNNKSCNQTNIEKDEVSLYTSLLESGLSAPIIEEIMFRGVLFIIILTVSNYTFKRSKRNFDALGISVYFLFSSIFFGYIHVAKCTDIENIGGYLASGIAFTLVFLMTRDIKIPIILHMLTNLIVNLNRHDYEYITSLISMTFWGIMIFIVVRAFLFKRSKARKDIKNKIYYYAYKMDKYYGKHKINKIRKIKKKK